jgi:hypothetical protein
MSIKVGAEEKKTAERIRKSMKDFEKNITERERKFAKSTGEAK